MIVRNARIVTCNEIIPGSVRIAEGRIEAISTGPCAVNCSEDWDGDWMIPGLVELHTDNLEKHLAPRPGVRWPALPAVLAHDAQLAAAGITTVFDALAIGDVKPGGTRTEHLHTMWAAIVMARESGALRADHLLHLRCELSTQGIPAMFETLASDPALALVSLMDHTPGQRQFTDISKYREYYQGKYALTNEAMDEFTAFQIDNHHKYSTANRTAIVKHCRAAGIALASHDDATPAHVAEAVADGVVIAEFPTTLEAARAAKAQGLGILMGAPNVVRGGSHSGNISALELAREGLLDVLSSDYVPASLMHAAFLLTENAGWSLPKAVACVSMQPAHMSGLTDRGEIAINKRADFLRVRQSHGVPVVAAAWRNGHRIL